MARRVRHTYKETDFICPEPKWLRTVLSSKGAVETRLRRRRRRQLTQPHAGKIRRTQRRENYSLQALETPQKAARHLANHDKKQSVRVLQLSIH